MICILYVIRRNVNYAAEPGYLTTELLQILKITYVLIIPNCCMLEVNKGPAAEMKIYAFFEKKKWPFQSVFKIQSMRR